jgi:hypothetical protein
LRSVVSCPGCRRRLRLTVDQPGKKLRCPACRTPFVIGAQLNANAAGPAEFVAFELFEGERVEEGFDIVVDPPAVESPPDPGAAVSIRVIKRSPFGVSMPRLSPTRAGKATRPSLADTIADGFQIIEKPASGVRKDRHVIPVDFNLRIEGILPEEFGLLDDEATKSTPPPSAHDSSPKHAAPKAESEPDPTPTPPPAYQPELGPDPDSRGPLLPEMINLKKPQPGPRPAAPKPPPPPSVPSPPPKKPAPATEFRITRVAPSPKRAPMRLEIVEHGFEIVRKPEPPPASVPKERERARAEPIEHGFEIIAKPPAKAEIVEHGFEIVSRPAAPAAAPSAYPLQTGVPVIQPLADDLARFEPGCGSFTITSPSPPSVPPLPESAPLRDDGLRDAQRQEAHRGWTFVFWGITSVLAAMGMTALALALLLLGGIGAALGIMSQSWEGAAGSAVILVIAAVLLLLQDVVALVGYSLCLGAPTRANLRAWAIATMVLAVLALSLNAFDTIAGLLSAHRAHVPGAGIIVGLLSLAKWICFLLFLRAIGEALRQRWIENEVWDVLRLFLIVCGLIVVLTLMTFCLNVVMGVGLVANAPRTGEGAVTAAVAIGIVTLLMFLIIFGLVAWVWVRYLILLLNVRSAVRERLER